MSDRNELKQLERDLVRDLEDSTPALRERIREQITKYLLTEAGRLTNTRPQEAAKVGDLLLLHYRVALLQKVIENPRTATPKEYRELIASIPTTGGGKSVNPIDLIDALDITDSEKAALLGPTLEAAKALARRELEAGQ